MLENKGYSEEHLIYHSPQDNYGCLGFHEEASSLHELETTNRYANNIVEYNHDIDAMLNDNFDFSNV